MASLIDGNAVLAEIAGAEFTVNYAMLYQAFFAFPLYTIAETPDFCQIVFIYPQSPYYQRYQKSPKREAHQLLQ